MADDSGDRTEKPTPKKLRDARQRGEVPKSQDLGLAVGLIAILLVLWQTLRIAPERLAALTEAVLDAARETEGNGVGSGPGSGASSGFVDAVGAIGAEALEALLLLSALVLLPVALVGLLVGFLQSGPVLTAEKLKPKLSNLNPVEGFKRMFGADNAVELLKSMLHTALLLGIGYHVIVHDLREILLTPYASPAALLEAMLQGAIRLFGWTLLTFGLLTVIDVAWQHHSFEKRMKMSFRDIRDEHKSSEGDPQIKGQRRRLAKEWARDDSKGSASRASVLVVNPVHLAVAVLYDEEESPVPTVIGRGEEETALDMREAAEAADVPVLRNETLARALFRDTSDGDLVPRELFGIVAEVTLWAQRARARIERERRGGPPGEDAALPVPGEDLTRYPSGDDPFESVEPALAPVPEDGTAGAGRPPG